jgi:hypothetical protein
MSGRQFYQVRSDGRYQRIGTLEEEMTQTYGSYRTCVWLTILTVIACAVFVAFPVTVAVLDLTKYTVWNSQNVKTISGVTVDASNNVEATAGLGLGFTPLPLSNSFIYSNEGVVTLNGLSSVDPTRDFTLAVTGPALSLTPGASTLTFDSPALVSINSIAGVANNFDITVSGPALTLTPGVGSIALGSPALVTINGNAGVANDFQVVAGTAIVVGTVGNVATISSPALLTINGNAGVANNFQVVGGTGIAVATVLNVATLSTPALLTINGNAGVANDFQFAAGNGLSIATVANTATYSDSLADATQLDNSDPLGPVVNYEVAIGFFVPVVENAGWRTGVVPGFPMPFVPGSVDDGQGNTGGGTGWAVPAVGTYHVNVDCEVIPGAIAVNDMQVVSAAFTLAAQSEDPLFLAILPAGAYTSLDISGGTNANVALAVPRRLSLSGTFQAGCTGCLVQVGDALTLHMSMERAGALPGPYDMNGYCKVQVARIR